MKAKVLHTLVSVVLSVLVCSTHAFAQLRLVQPATGATLVAGETTQLQWVGEPPNSTIALEHFVFNEWTTVATGISSPYAWIVPSTTSAVSLRLTANVASPPALIEEYPNDDIETFHTAFETASGDHVVAFGFAINGPRKEHVVRVWESGNPAVVVNEFRETIGDPAFNDLEIYSPTGLDSLLFSVGTGLRIIPLTSNIGNVITIPGIESIYAVAVHPNRPIIAVCDRDQGDGVVVYDMDNRAVVATFRTNEQTPLYSIEFSQTGQYLLYGSGQRLIVRDWETESDGDAPYNVVAPFQGFVKDIALSDESNRVYASTYGGRLYEIDIHANEGNQFGPNLFSQSWRIDSRESDSRTLASALLSTTSTLTGEFFQFSANSSTPLSQTEHGGRLFTVAYTASGEYIISAGGRENNSAAMPSIIKKWTAGEWFEESTEATFDIQTPAQIVLPQTTATAGDNSSLLITLRGAQDVVQSGVDVQFRASFTYPSHLWYPTSELVEEHLAVGLGRNLLTIVFGPEHLQQDSIIEISGVALLGQPIRDDLLWEQVSVVPQLLSFDQINGDYGIFESCITNVAPQPKPQINVVDPPSASISTIHIQATFIPAGSQLVVTDLNGRRLCEPQSLPESSEMRTIPVEIPAHAAKFVIGLVSRTNAVLTSVQVSIVP